MNTSKLVLKTNLANLKAERDQIDVDKLTVPTDLRKLSNLVNNDVVKKKLCMIN